MTDQQVTQEQYEQLIDDVSYLQDEAEALKYIIDQVPYAENPPDGMSIYQMLRLIDYAQTDYYRPIVEKVFSENRTVNLSDYIAFEETFEIPEEEKIDIQKALSKIIKHRAGLINIFRKIPLIDWERKVKDEDNRTISLFTFANKMIRTERKILRDIADLVMIYQKEKQSQREIDKKVEQRKST
ncbi:MAG: hypothetical protein WD604_14730 [Balneolaceae bacterium]